MGTLLNLIPKIQEGLFADFVELLMTKEQGRDPRPELEGKGDAEVIPLVRQTGNIFPL